MFVTYFEIKVRNVNGAFILIIELNTFSYVDLSVMTTFDRAFSHLTFWFVTAGRAQV